MTAPTTEQAREAVERLNDALFNHDRFRGGNVPEFIERVRPADIRTVLSALDAKDEQEKALLRAVLAEGTVAAERIIGRVRPTPSAPAEPPEMEMGECDECGEIAPLEIPFNEDRALCSSWLKPSPETRT